jgi:hypothetical protein
MHLVPCPWNFLKTLRKILELFIFQLPYLLSCPNQHVIFFVIDVEMDSTPMDLTPFIHKYSTMSHVI